MDKAQKLMLQCDKKSRLRMRCRKKDRPLMEHTFLISSCSAEGIAHCAFCGARWD